MQDDTERDVTADPQAKRKNDPFLHHRNDRPRIRGGNR